MCILLVTQRIQVVKSLRVQRNFALR